MNLLQYFYENELFYVDEIDRIKEGKYYGDEAGGWFFLLGNKGSGDWDMARLIGELEDGAKYFSQVPKENTVFMVSRRGARTDTEPRSGHENRQNNLFDLSEYPKKAVIRCYASKARSLCDFSDFFKGNSLEKGYSFTHSKNYTWLCYKGVGIGYVMPIRQSKNAVEVYIEIAPEHRGKGLSLALLKTAVKHLSSHNKRIVYLVFEDNLPSIKLVQRAGFEQIGIIDTYGAV